MLSFSPSVIWDLNSKYLFSICFSVIKLLISSNSMSVMFFHK
nr:MAG TPA: hypothetical protein [Caudoviricetes sp.]